MAIRRTTKRTTKRSSKRSSAKARTPNEILADIGRQALAEGLRESLEDTYGVDISDIRIDLVKPKRTAKRKPAKRRR